VEEPSLIELSPAGASEFQAPDHSEALLELSPGKSEFQVPDDGAALLELAAGTSEFQTPDPAEELRFTSGSGSEYQTPSGADELLASGARATTPEEASPVEIERSWGRGEEPDGLAGMASMPTEEMATTPPAAEPPERLAGAPPSWMFEDEYAEPEPELAPPAPVPVASAAPEPVVPDLPKEPPAPVIAQWIQPAAPPLFEPEPVEPAGRSTAELRLIFPDDAGEPEPEPYQVRRITEPRILPAPAGAEAEPEIGEPEPVMTETMAELYARQGHTAEALRVYLALAERQPHDNRLKERIRELESRSASVPRRMTYVALETGGESVESFFRSLAEARPGSGGIVSGFGPAKPAANDSSGAPTRPARDPLSLSAIFGEEPAAAPSAAPEVPAAPPKPALGADAFSFDQFFGGSGAGTPGSSSSTRPPGASEEDLDQFQNWLKSLKK
jgi:hypothetical protein